MPTLEQQGTKTGLSLEVDSYPRSRDVCSRTRRTGGSTARILKDHGFGIEN